MSKGKEGKEKEGKGKEGKGKSPNAFELNPMMMDQLSQITPENFIQFTMANPEIVP